MEDRHAISEPRPSLSKSGDDNNMPSWEVDILRDETVIVDTLVLNSEVLPPRTNKKGKVVWRLPDTADKLPSFGKDDRLRILDIFRERKKKRKQEKKKRQSASEDGIRGGESMDDMDPMGDSGHGNFSRSNSSVSRGGSEEENAKGSKVKLAGKENGQTSANFSNERGDNHKLVQKGKSVNGKGSMDQKQTRTDFQAERGKEISVEDPTNGLRRPRTSPSPQRPPPGLRATHDPGVNSSTQIDQNQSNSQTHLNQSLPQSPSTPDPSRLSLHDSHNETTSSNSPKPHSLSSSHKTHPSNITQSFSSRPSPPPPDALFIIVPRIERPDPLPGEMESSLAVPAARYFISTYYAHFDVTSPNAIATPINNLARYYTSKAQKSVSVGGAHSVVTGRRDIAAQILNLAGAAFAVRGVVAQDAADGKGVHILVTGTARTGGVLANFAHSISLTPVDYSSLLPPPGGLLPPPGGVLNHANNGDEQRRGDYSCQALVEAKDVGFPFQIHNDALALLSGESAVTSQPPPMQQPPPPPPPPGLF